MKKILGLLIVIMTLSVSTLSYAQDVYPTQEEQDALAQASFDKINEVLKKIYDHILTLKGRYRELVDFDEKALTKNAYGLYTIAYATAIPAAGGQSSPFEFALTVEIPKDKTYLKQPGYFTYPMPMLGLQFVGYTIKHPYRRQFDISQTLDKFAEEMVDYQQQFMPLKMYILPSKTEYEIGEEIVFKVVLANVSKHSLLVNNLTKQTLFFMINDKYWGILSESDETIVPADLKEQRRQARMQARAARKEARKNRRRSSSSYSQTMRGYATKVGEQFILRSGDALTMDFSGESFMHPQDVVIRGIYKLNIKGLKPTTTATIKIIKEASESQPKVVEK